MMADLELWKFIVLQGGFAVLAFAAGWLAKAERAERKEAQTELNAVGKRSIEADFTVAKSLDALTTVLNNLVNLITDGRRP